MNLGTVSAKAEADLLAAVRETVEAVIEKHIAEIEKRIERRVDVLLAEHIASKAEGKQC